MFRSNVLTPYVWVLLLIVLVPTSLLAQRSNRTRRYADNQLHLKLKIGANTPEALPPFNLKDGGELPSTLPQSLTTLFRQHQVNQLRSMAIGNDANMARWYWVSFPSKTTADMDAFIRSLESTGLFEIVERVPIRKRYGSVNDPRYSDQWHLAKVNATQAWDVSTGSSSVVIAILDDAVLTTHQDLTSKIALNTADPVNGQDDDNNGYIDDHKGWDFGDNDNNPDPVILDNDSMSHGTHCAGIAAAHTNNGTGIAGLGYNVKLLAVKLGTDATYALEGSTALAIAYSVARGAKVISMSFGSPDFSQAEQDAVTAAHNAGVVLVAASGNDDSEDLNTIGYPARYTHVIMVASTDQNDLKSSFSNYNAAITLSAPGTQILSTYAVGGPSASLAVANASYDYSDGTSMATPLVAGLAGLIFSHNSTLTATQVRNILTSTCVNIDGLNSTYAGKLGAGRIDAEAALNATTSARQVLAKDVALSLYPNPATEFLYLSTAKPLEGTVTLLNPAGQQLLQTILEGQQTRLSVAHLPVGIYYLRILLTDGSQVTDRVMVK